METITVNGVGHFGMLLSRQVIGCITVALSAHESAAAADSSMRLSAKGFLTIRGGVNRRGRIYGGKQAALRRVATLFARCADSSEVSSAPAQEMTGCLHVQNAAVTRYDDAVVTLLSAALDPNPKERAKRARASRVSASARPEDATLAL